MPDIAENALIASLASFLPRSPDQLNGLQESDAELIQIPGAKEQILAVTTDSIAEEIDCGLYSDSYLVGWMVVMANLSDLAAVGAKPLGLLISETLPHAMTECDRARLQSGIRDACLAAGTVVLGGDTSVSDHLQLSATAIGLVSESKPMQRMGCEQGDLVFSTGKLGSGNAFAIETFANSPSKNRLPYLPVARVHEGGLIRSVASACMDTSDGLFATLDQLGRLNHLGFHLSQCWEQIIDPESLKVAVGNGLDPWMLLAGPHGEFELIFTVHPRNLAAMKGMISAEGWSPILLGTMVGTPGIALEGWGQFDLGDLATIRNFPIRKATEIKNFIGCLFEIGKSRRTSTQL